MARPHSSGAVTAAWPPVPAPGPKPRFAPPAVAAPAQPAWRDPSLQADLNNGLRRLGMFFFLMLLFMRLSTIHETLAFSFHIPYVLFLAAPPAILFALFSGALKKIFIGKPGYFWLAFVFWMLLATPFSVWISASIGLWLTFIRTELILFICAAGLIACMKDLDRVFWVGAAACVALTITSRLFMNLSYGRVALSFGTISNANDFAAHQIFMLPFVAYLIVRPGTNFLFRLIALGELLYCTYQILGSASRGAMIALVVMSLMIFWRIPASKKFIALILTPVILIGALAVLPETTTARLASIFNSSNDSRQTAEEIEAALSKEKRLYLLGKSIEYTFALPVFGVGPGQFSTYEGQNSKVIGDHGAWNQTHNVYTQISSECGIPALIFYLGAIFSTGTLLSRVARYSRGRKDCEHLALASFSLFVGLVGFCLAIFFLTLGYRFYLPLLSGLAIAIHEVARREYNLFGAPRPVSPAPMGVPF